MKYLNHFFISKTIACAISIFALQARTCSARRTIKAEHAHFKLQRMDGPQWNTHVTHTPDISRHSGRRNLLHMAIASNKVEKVAIVLQKIAQDAKLGQKYAHNNFQNTFDLDHDKTALGFAIEKGNVEIINLLLESPYIDTTKVKKGVLNALIFAIQKKKDIKILSLILKRYTKDDQKINLGDQDQSGKTVLHWAVEKAIPAAFVAQLAHAMELDQLYIKDKNNSTALHLAAYYNRRQSFSRLIKALHAKDPSGKWVDQLLQPDVSGSVFSNAYLGSTMATDTTEHRQAFEDMSKELTLFLKDNHHKEIESEINRFIAKGIITEYYAEWLRATIQGTPQPIMYDTNFILQDALSTTAIEAAFTW